MSVSPHPVEYTRVVLSHLTKLIWCHYYRLQWKAREQQHTLEAEVVDHEKFIQEMSDTAVWLHQLKEELDQPLTIGLVVEEVQDNINKHEVSNVLFIYKTTQTHDTRNITRLMVICVKGCMV